MISEEEQRRMYEEGGNTAAFWEWSADDLLAAATVLRKQREQVDIGILLVDDEVPIELSTLGAELMLRGYAIECLFKSLWLKGGNTFINGGQFQDIRGAGSHDLIQLATAVGFKLDAQSKDVLKRLSCYIRFAGRYPVPKKFDEGRIQKNLRGEGFPTFWAILADYQTFEKLVDDIRAKLRADGSKQLKTRRLA